MEYIPPPPHPFKPALSTPFTITTMILLDDQCFVDTEGFVISLSQEAAEQLTDEEYSLYLAGQLEYTLTEIL